MRKTKNDFRDVPFNRIKVGHYTDQYFNNTIDTMVKDGNLNEVLMQVFNKTGGVVCGLDESIVILQNCIKDSRLPIEIRALKDGDRFEPFETVMTIEGALPNFAHLETVILGIISRGTRVATNVENVVNAANGKSVFFFPARFDRFENQRADGYAAEIGGANAVSTPSQSQMHSDGPKGTMPHALIAGYEGWTDLATQKFAEAFPKQDIISLVDWDNDCVRTTMDVVQRMHTEGYKLHGVRIDTSGTMVDKSVIPMMNNFKPTGVCPQVVQNVRKMLDDNGFNDVKIYVSGGFNPVKIKMFEDLGLPVDGYGVGSSMFNGNYDFTADVVQVKGVNCAKVGRMYNPNTRLGEVI